MPRNTRPATGKGSRPGGAHLTLAQVRKLPATCSVSDAAAALGISRSNAYDLVAAGQAPFRVLDVGHRKRVVTASLLAMLDPAGDKAGAA